MMRYAMIFDTETTTDPTQRLNFGIYRIYELTDDERIRSLITEGILYADDLFERDPDGYWTLHSYAANHPVPIDPMAHTNAVASDHMFFFSRTEFVERIVWGFVYKYEMGIVGFNLPFDLSRIAIDVGPARGFHQGGFSLSLWEPGPYRPRVLIKHLDSRKSFIGFGPTTEQRWRGVFVDLRTLAFGLSNKAHSLQSACDAFGVTGKAPVTEHGGITEEYIEYCRQDVNATANLYDALMRDFRTHPIDKHPQQIYSPASIVKGYFAAMGIRPLLRRSSIPQEIHGYTMSTFYGGRAEIRIRKELTPVTLLDFTSMYPTVGHLMGLWNLITARDVEAVEDTIDLTHVDLDYCLDARHWREFVGIAEIRPNDDVLPVRTRYGPDDSTNIGVNRLSAPDTRWYALPDVIASRILTGRSPEIVRVVRFRPVGAVRGLRPVALLSRVEVPPSRDFFKYAVEERQRVKKSDPQLAELLKTMSNSGSYGIFAQINQDKLAAPTTVDLMCGMGAIPRETSRVEKPGQFFFPPLATLPTSGARLMLAMLEKMVTDAGGYWVFMDTDSCAVTGAANPEEIISRFNTLNPYDRTLVPSLLKKEFTGFCYAISAKRYALVSVSGEIVKTSQHGLGYLRSPIPSQRTQWISRIWEGIVNVGAEPDWLDRPALMPFNVSSWRLYDSFSAYNEGRAYPDRIKPFNFMLVGSVHDRWQRDAILIAPHEPDPDKWRELIWIDKHNPSRTYQNPPLKTFRDVVDDYARHPEYKFWDSENRQCGPDTTGRLRRMRLYAATRTVIGKESNELQQGLFSVENTEPVLLGHEWSYWWPLITPFLDSLIADKVISQRSVTMYNRGKRPTRTTMARVLNAAVHYAMRDLRGLQLRNTDPATVLETWKYAVTHDQR